MQEFLSNEVLGLVTVGQIVVILHLFGVALGAGAAFFSDFLFTHILRDRKVSADQFSILKLNSTVVWLGLSLLVVSGVTLFLGNQEFYLESSKFLAKMTIVGLLSINGVLFHFYHLPFMGQFVGKDLTKQKKFVERSKSFFVSGGISGVSWAAALVLGSLRSVDLTYAQIMFIYFAAAFLAGIAGLGLHKHYLEKGRK